MTPPAGARSRPAREGPETPVERRTRSRRPHRRSPPCRRSPPRQCRREGRCGWKAEERPTRVVAMAQHHLARLSSTDVTFLTNESSTSHMHVGAIMIFEGPAPSYDDLV